jgi:hypothetical protein
MPMFYSNIRSGDDYAADLEGEDFANLEAAKIDAEERLLVQAAEDN